MMFKETEVSKANIDVSEAGKPSAGARILKGQNIDQTRLLLFLLLEVAFGISNRKMF